MYTLLVSGLITLLMTLAGGLGLLTHAWLQQTRFDVRQVDFSNLSRDLEHYRVEAGVYPDSLQAMADRVGFEHVRPVDSVAVHYTKTTSLTGALWTYDRAGLVSQDVLDVRDVAAVFGASPCASTGTFVTATAWCGRDRDAWRVAESKDLAAADLALQRSHLNFTARKFALYYTANGSFPNPGIGTVTLAAQVGYAGSAGNCAGVWNWGGIPLGCDDLFTTRGQEVAYVYQSSKSIELTAPSVWRSNTGQVVALSIPLSLP